MQTSKRKFLKAAVTADSRFTKGVKQGQGAQVPSLPLHPHPGS
jgi:hypothetical protein